MAKTKEIMAIKAQAVRVAKSLNTAIAKRGQTVNYVEIVRLDTLTGYDTLRIRIRADSYVDQSYAVVERWSATAWCEVYTIPGVLLATPNKLAYRRTEPTAADFNADRSTLLARAADVLV